MQKDEENTGQPLEILRTLLHIAVLSFFCVTLSVPGFTAADAAASMYYVMLKLARKEECGIVQAYFHFFGENFVKSLPYGIVMTVINGLLYIPLISARLSWNPEIPAIAVPAALILGMNLFSAWVLLLFAQFDNTVINTVTNAARLAADHPRQSLVLLVLNGLMTVMFVISPEVFLWFLAVWLLFGIGAAGYFSAGQAAPVFDELIRAAECDDPVIEDIEHAEDGTGEISL